ncbi:MAG: VOC family protein [Armatimonadetes bacterium]|nr:VOC family protein [Armatimonadota bacterium]
MSYQVENAIPVLRIANMERSLAFYVDVLGFEIEWQGEQTGGIAGLRRDNAPVMLTTLDGSGPGMVWIGVSDVRPIHAAILAMPQPMEVLYPPTRNSYAADFQVKDADGNVLWFGCGE